jgi:DNA polymerase III sliding clamp (beta) subunit (PCNA family)
MKTKLITEKLNTCLSYIGMIVKGDGLVPIYNQIQLDFKDNILEISAYDNSYGVQVKYGKCEHPNGRYLIDGPSFIHLLKFSSSIEIEVDFQEGQLVVKEQGNKYNFIYFKNERDVDLSYIFTTYSELPEPIVQITSKEFSEVYKFLSPTIGQDVARPFLMGIQYDGNFVATDGNNCGVYSYKPLQEKKIFLPKGGLDFLCSFPNEEPFSIYDVNNMIVIVWNNVEFVIPQINGAYPNYHVLSERTKSYPFTVKLNKAEFYRSCQKLVPFADKHMRKFCSAIFMTDGSVLISAASEGTKAGQESVKPLEATVPDKDLLIHPSIKKLAELIAAHSCENLTIRFSSNSAAPLVLTDNNVGFHYMSVYNLSQEG